MKTTVFVSCQGLIMDLSTVRTATWTKLITWFELVHIALVDPFLITYAFDTLPTII